MTTRSAFYTLYSFVWRRDISLAATQALAAPANQSALPSVAHASRASDASSGKSELASVGILPAILAAGVIVGGIIIAADHNDDRPDSN